MFPTTCIPPGCMNDSPGMSTPSNLSAVTTLSSANVGSGCGMFEWLVEPYGRKFEPSRSPDFVREPNLATISKPGSFDTKGQAAVPDFVMIRYGVPSAPFTRAMPW